jgi:glycosyltransferase involved in cell wall biosynthesis
LVISLDSPGLLRPARAPGSIGSGETAPFDLRPRRLASLQSRAVRAPDAATIDVVIPAYNEEASLPLVLADLAGTGARRVVVADNNSSDATAAVARAGGAEVVLAGRQGYGSACLAALAHLRATGPPAIVVFVDADYSDHPDELPLLVEPIVEDRADVVIGSRVLGRREPGALMPQARAGNAVAVLLIRLLYGHRFTDLGPFRAARWSSLERIGMRDRDFGWTAEMQVKALRHGLRVAEVPVSYRRRVGVSKITGTVGGTVHAGWKILSTVVLYAWRRI